MKLKTLTPMGRFSNFDYIGNAELLNKPAISIGGSRNVSKRGIDITKELVREQCQDYVIVSGGARGVDSFAHQMALLEGGSTVVVVASGIKKYYHNFRDTTKDNFLVISEFEETDDWEPSNAMIRNETIIEIGECMVVVESGVERSGTYQAGKTTLEMSKPLYVIDYGAENPEGNAELLKSGGIPVNPDDLILQKP